MSTSRAISFLPNEGGLDGAMLRFADVVGDSAFAITRGGGFEFLAYGEEGELRKVSDDWFLSQAKFGSKYLGAMAFGIFESDRYTRRKVVPEDYDVTAIIVAKFSPKMAYYATEGQLRALREHDGQYEVLATETMGAKIESIVEDRAGDIWVAAGSEVRTLSFAAEGDRFIERQVFQIVDDPSPATAMTKLFGIGDEVFLIRGGSLSAHDGAGSFKPVPLLQGAEVLDVATVDTGESWALVRPKGHDAESPRLVRLTVAGGVLKAEELGTEGLQSAGQLRNVHTVDTGSNPAEVWIGTDKGIIRMRPELAKFAVQSPLLNVSMSRIEEGVTHSIPFDDVELPNGHGPVSFAWSAPGSVPAEIFVETRILGADGRWQAAADRSTREFSGLGDGSYEFQVRTVDALGRPGQIASRAFAVLPPWYRTTGAISGFCAAAVLVTGIGWQLRMRVARRRAEELEGLVEDRTRELECVNAEKTRFIARMNHEIRNPLNGLLGAIGILEQYSHRGREGRMVHILRACADHLGAVVEDVLDFSSIEGGRIVVQDRAVSVAAMLEAVPRMLHAESERTGTEIITTVAPEVPAVVIADPDRIRQILMNFVGNALKYAPGEPVHIEVTAASQDGAQSLRFAVRDHGPGISEAEKQILFSMFERGKGATRRNARGMGIGLATCRLLARHMGGEVGVISGLGEGSEFFLRLPLKVESGAIPLPETQPQTELFKIACLIVEDQEFNRVILKDMLDRFGCRVDEAPDAESALRLSAMNRYDVVFTDLELPDAAPGEILNMLQNQQSAANTPVPALVVTTAYATENVRQTCLDAGAAAFLGKPLSASKVLAVLREIDSARRPAPAVIAPTQEPVAGKENVLIAQLARIRGSSVETVASEIAGNIADEVRMLRASVSSESSRDTAHHAHRLLSLSALAVTPELAGVAAGIQHDAHEGRLPEGDRLAALDAAMIAAKEKLSAIRSGAAAGAQSRAPGRSEPTASSHSD
ncbi:MAG TPA: ATP-binding protein [Opitutaceae bacterium]|nr:ATP-binding protein [Opitutaceae bacterium]